MREGRTQKTNTQTHRTTTVTLDVHVHQGLIKANITDIIESYTEDSTELSKLRGGCLFRCGQDNRIAEYEKLIENCTVTNSSLLQSHNYRIP